MNVALIEPSEKPRREGCIRASESTLVNARGDYGLRFRVQGLTLSTALWQSHMDKRYIRNSQEHKATGGVIDDVNSGFRGPSLIRHDRRLQVLELIEMF